MSPDYKLSLPLKATVLHLLQLAKLEHVPDPGEGFLGLTGLSPETRRVHLIMDLYDKDPAVVRSRVKDEPSLEEITPGSLDALSEDTKYIPTETFLEPLPPPDPPPLAAVAVPTPPEEAKPVPFQSAVPAFPAGSVLSENLMALTNKLAKKAIYLKNAKANAPYETTLEVEGLRELRLEDNGGSGLALDEASARLMGRPATSGDFVLRFQGLLQGKQTELVAHLAVIPDPKSLWISKDSDREAPFWKPDEAFARTEGALLCVAASKRGRSHAKDGTFRDDDFGLLTRGPEGWHIAVVADGAGSAPYSRQGSKVAVDRVLGDLPKLLEDHVTPHLSRLVPAHQEGNPDATVQIQSQLYQSLATAAFNAAKAIEEEAAAHDEKASAFSTTLIISVARKIPEGWFMAGFSVGDGGAAVFDRGEKTLVPLTLPDSGEFAGQTRFLQKSEFSGGFAEVVKRLFFVIKKDFTALALMTDGISDPKFPTDKVFADPAQWESFWNDDLCKAVDFSRTNPEMEKQFLDWLDFWSPGNHDDRTLAVLMP